MSFFGNIFEEKK